MKSKRIVSLLLVAVLMLCALCGCSTEESYDDDNAVTTTTTTTNQTVLKGGVTATDVKVTINEAMDMFPDATDAMYVQTVGVKEEDGTTIHSLKFMQEKITVSVYEKDAQVTMITAVTAPGNFYIPGSNTETEAIATAIGFSLVPLSACYEDGDFSVLTTKVMGGTSETITENGTTMFQYTYSDGKWEYTVLFNASLITAVVTPVK